jgi:hypothetical protein
MGDRSCCKDAAYTQDNTNTEHGQTSIRVSSGIRTHNLNIGEGKGSSCLTRSGHSHRQQYIYIQYMYALNCGRLLHEMSQQLILYISSVWGFYLLSLFSAVNIYNDEKIKAIPVTGRGDS